MAIYRLCYGRVSTQQQEIELQLSQFESIQPDQIYWEKLSGGRRDRPEFARMVDHALEVRGQGRDVEIYCVELSRWARDTAFSLMSIERLEAAGVRLYEIAGEAVTLQTTDGLLKAGFKSLMAHYYRVDLSERITRSHADRRRRQRPNGGPPPWGYKLNEDKSQLIPSEEWDLCRKTIERFIEGETLTGLVRWLWAEHRVKKTTTGLNKWLNNPALRGCIEYLDGTLLHDRHERLLSDSEWQSMQHRFKVNRQLRGKNKGRIYAVPAGMVTCWNCGGRCSVCCSGKQRYFYCYRANKRGDCPAQPRYCRQDWIEAAIQEAIIERAEELASAILEPSAPSPLIVQREREIEALRPLAHRPNIQAEIEAIRTEIEQLRSEGQATAVDEQQRQQNLLDIAWASPDDWAQLSEEQRRILYCDLVRTIEVSGPEVLRVELSV